MSWEVALQDLLTNLPIVAFVVWRLEKRLRAVERKVSELCDIETRNGSEPPSVE